jgi:hypothetical protein
MLQDPGQRLGWPALSLLNEQMAIAAPLGYAISRAQAPRSRRSSPRARAVLPAPPPRSGPWPAPAPTVACSSRAMRSSRVFRRGRPRGADNPANAPASGARRRQRGRFCIWAESDSNGVVWEADRRGIPPTSTRGYHLGRRRQAWHHRLDDSEQVAPAGPRDSGYAVDGTGRRPFR